MKLIDYLSNYTKKYFSPLSPLSMDEYKIKFDLDSKIAWNRQRLREVFEQYKSVEKYYPIFFAYIGFLGIYFFDFITYLIFEEFSFLNSLIDFLFFLLVDIIVVFVIWAFVLMVQIVSLKDWHHESLPKVIYKQTYDANKKIYPSDTDADIENRTKKGTLIMLEGALDKNNKITSNRKKKLGLLMKLIVFTFIVYTFTIVFYKILTHA